MTRRVRLLALEIGLAAIIAVILLFAVSTGDWLQVLLWGGPLSIFVLMLLWTRALLRRDQADRWDRSGKCPSCGYDLRASTDRCPECGSRIRLP